MSYTNVRYYTISERQIRQADNETSSSKVILFETFLSVDPFPRLKYFAKPNYCFRFGKQAKFKKGGVWGHVDCMLSVSRNSWHAFAESQGSEKPTLRNFELWELYTEV